MPPLLYLDTARLGKMSLGAQHALSEFHSLAGDIGCCMYFEEFLQHGFTTARDDTPLLNTWCGISGLKQRLKRFVGADADSRVLLANRSSQLMTLAAHLLAQRCRHVLITDLCWPSYAIILRTIATKYECRVSCLPLRHSIYSDRVSATDLIEAVRGSYHALGCDGLILPLVDNLGVHFPVRDCIAAIKTDALLNFAAVDGAQALGHVPIQLADLQCDFFLAGCHKWLRAYQPLGLGFFGRSQSHDFIRQAVDGLRVSRAIDDPLLDFTEDCCRGRRSAFGETVNLSPLFTCHGALEEAEGKHPATNENHWEHAEAIRQAAFGTQWSPVLTDHSVRSNVFLLESGNGSPFDAEAVRHHFHQSGVALTVYTNGSIRLSLPLDRMASSQCEQLAASFRTCPSSIPRSYSA